MDKDKDRKPGPVSGGIEEILRRRAELDGLIREKFKKELAILFTDICGYTQFMDARGDIEGRALLQRHNDIVFSRVDAHGGRVIKTIGDAVMASFNTALDAVKAAVAVQEGLDRHNRAAGVRDEIHVKIGVNSGTALVDGHDLFGDAVNVAARIQSQAGKDEILISEGVYQDVRSSEDILCRYHGEVSVKGKPEPLLLYRVIWRQEEEGAPVEGLVRSGAPGAVRAEAPPGHIPSVLHLELNLEGDILKVGFHEQGKGEESTIRRYEERPFSRQAVDGRVASMVELLNRATRQGRVSKEALLKLRDTGKVLYDELLPPSVKEMVAGSRAGYLVLNLDEKLVQVPWELLNDGNRFLCLRFGVGRIVKTRQKSVGTRQRVLGHPLKMLILADPRGDLKDAYGEGVRVRDELDGDPDLVNVSFRTEGITSDFLREKIRNFDMVHFAGHSDYDAEHPERSRWLLSEGGLSAGDIMKMAGTGTMPALVFSNACESARTGGWSVEDFHHEKIFGLANAFLLAGARHYVGTLWDVLDEPGRLMAETFYRGLIWGDPVGDALRRARVKVIEAYGEETIVWAGYVLYGDPAFRYLGERSQAEEAERPRPMVVPQKNPSDVRSREEVIAFGEEKSRRSRKGLFWALAGGLILAVALAWVGFQHFRPDTGPLEREIMLLYLSGDYPGAAKVCDRITGVDSSLALPYLVLAKIRLSEGDLEGAELHFKRVLESGRAGVGQRAEALMGLGRICSLRNQSEAALQYYEKASALAPQRPGPYLSRAMLLSREKEAGPAESLLRKVLTLSGDDPGVRAFARQALDRIAFSRNEERRKKVDRLVRSLLGRMNQPAPPPHTDGWTSSPLTVWIMDFEVTGCGAQEGEDALVQARLSDLILEGSHAQVVERAVLDKVLEELKGTEVGHLPAGRSQRSVVPGKDPGCKAHAQGRDLVPGPHDARGASPHRNGDRPGDGCRGKRFQQGHEAFGHGGLLGGGNPGKN